MVGSGSEACGSRVSQPFMCLPAVLESSSQNVASSALVTSRPESRTRATYRATGGYLAHSLSTSPPLASEISFNPINW
ncbi:hypothetical protein D3C83_25770 [compost metagenome]